MTKVGIFFILSVHLVFHIYNVLDMLHHRETDHLQQQSDSLEVFFHCFENLLGFFSLLP